MQILRIISPEREWWLQVSCQDMESSGKESIAARSAEVGALFDDVAEHFDRMATRMIDAEGPFRTWLDAQLPGGDRALDVGCGTGRHCPLLAERYAQVLGVDLSEALIHIARRTRPAANIRYEARSAYDVEPAADGVFDVVFAFSAVFHMRPYEQILPHLRSLVAPGGRLVVLEPQRTDLHARKGRDADWHIPVAFQNAEAVYRATADAGAATDALNLFLHPSWHKLGELNTLPSSQEFRDAYSGWLPGAQFFDGVAVAMAAAVWQAPDPN